LQEVFHSDERKNQNCPAVAAFSIMHEGKEWKETRTHTRLTALFPGLPRSADNRKVKSIGILVKQETVTGSGISWAIYKSAPHSRQITTPAPHHSTGKRNKIKFEARKEQRKRREEKGREREGMAGRKMGNQREERGLIFYAVARLYLSFLLN